LIPVSDRDLETYPDIQTDYDAGGQRQNVLDVCIAGFNHLAKFGENRPITVRELL